MIHQDLDVNEGVEERFQWIEESLLKISIGTERTLERGGRRRRRKGIKRIEREKQSEKRNHYQGQ